MLQWGTEAGTIKNFLSMGSNSTNYVSQKNARNRIFSFRVYLERKGSVSEIVVYDFLSMMGELGGFHDALSLLIGFMISYYASKLADHSLVSSIFKISNKPDCTFSEYMDNLSAPQ
jgi:hypothetical protein